MRTSAVLLHSMLLLLPVAVVSQTSIRVASIGDYGAAANTPAVAAMVAGWNPDLVITGGDNNYTPNDTTIFRWDVEVGAPYHPFIRYPAGSTSAYAPGSLTNRFFPSVGNHDFDAIISGWYRYFELPDNERYYDVVRGPVHFFSVSSDPREPDGNTSDSPQALWLQERLAASTSRWNIVYFHHPPYTSATRGNNVALQWPFKEWGASVVINGHEHHYERIMKNGFPYIINGAGGRPLSGFAATPEPGSVVRFSGNNGAMVIDANMDSLVFTFYSIQNGGTLVDRYVTTASPTNTVETTLVSAGASWKYLDNNSNQGTAWRAVAFNDGAWASGSAKLGFGDANNATTINGGPSGARFTTTYFRHQFVVSDTAMYSDLKLDVLRDDGAVVYLNGVEVWRTNMPAGTITNSTLASVGVGGADETAFYTTTLSPESLRNGTNVLAVEVHQVNATSSDLGFDLRLTGMTSGGVRLSVYALLEGPFNPLTGRMETTLNPAGHLAARYPGAPVHPDAVDSITIEIRDAVSAASSTMRKFRPAWLLSNGTIRSFADTTKPYVEFDAAPGNYYVVVSHANHLSIMASASQPLTGLAPASYNFTTSQLQAYGSNPMKQVNPGVYALFAGDGNASGIVSAADANGVFGFLSLAGYNPLDVNLSGIVTSADANLIFGNLNASTQVP